MGLTGRTKRKKRKAARRAAASERKQSSKGRSIQRRLERGIGRPQGSATDYSSDGVDQLRSSGTGGKSGNEPATNSNYGPIGGVPEPKASVPSFSGLGSLNFSNLGKLPSGGK